MTKKLLIIDDDELVLLSLEELFLARRYEVAAVPNGQEALKRAREERFDLVVTDVIMPGISGFEVTKSLRAMPDYAKIPIVILTAKSGEDDRAHGMEAGASHFLPKPINPGELLTLVESIFGQ